MLFLNLNPHCLLHYFYKGSPELDIFCSNEQSSVTISQTDIQQFVKTVLENEGQSADELSIAFVDKSEISALHEKFFSDPSPTDCISIPMDEGEDTEIPDHRVLGDIFVCPQVAIEYVKENGGEIYEEISLYLLHGLLHLLGYDDISEEDRLQMRQAEKRNLNELKKLNLLLKP